jgi:hypothetical protein
MLGVERKSHGGVAKSVFDPFETSARHSTCQLPCAKIRLGKTLSSASGEVMRRRDFILGSGATVAWPFAARAQQATLPIIGYLSPLDPEPTSYLVAAFRKGLSEVGFVEGQNVAIEFRWGRHESDHFPELAADLVRRKVAVITAMGSNALAAQPRRRRLRYRSSSPLATTRSKTVWSPPSTGRVET